MTGLDLSAWVPRGVEERAGVFARVVVARADPPSWARARSLLWAASRLCDTAPGWGLEPEPTVLLRDAEIERFIVIGTASWSGALLVRNLRVLDAFDARAAEDQRRAAAGLGPKIRRRRRTTISDLVGVAAPP